MLPGCVLPHIVTYNNVYFVQEVADVLLLKTSNQFLYCTYCMTVHILIVGGWRKPVYCGKLRLK